MRLTKWYSPYSQKEKARIMREVTSMVLSRPPKMCNFIEWKEKKIVYKRCVIWGGGVRARPPSSPHPQCPLSPAPGMLVCIS